MKFKGTRRKFIAVSAVVVGGLAVIQSLWPKSNKKPTSAKFLTQDGTLVDVPLDKLPKSKTAISKECLVSWVWKDQTL